MSSEHFVGPYGKVGLEVTDNLIISGDGNIRYFPQALQDMWHEG